MTRYDGRGVCQAWLALTVAASPGLGCSRRWWLDAAVVVSVAGRRHTPHQTTELKDVLDRWLCAVQHCLAWRLTRCRKVTPLRQTNDHVEKKTDDHRADRKPSGRCLAYATGVLRADVIDGRQRDVDDLDIWGVRSRHVATMSSSSDRQAGV